MKKFVTLFASLVLIVLFAACNLSNLTKKSGESQPAESATTAEQPAPPPSEPPAQTQPPAPTKTQPEKPAATQPATPQTATQPATSPATPPATPATTETTAKGKKAGLGVIFTTDLEKGSFRLKSDNDVLIDHTFSGKDVRVTRELLLPAGAHQLKFVVADERGARGVRTMDVTYQPGTHHVIKVQGGKSPGDITLTILE
ncbi:MAG: hypothetical protein WBS54_11915 [Acidobacteriota bacterium]